MKPTPPSHLNKELLGVWNAWCYKGDKEVIRESAAKGSNIELAYTFLATRQQLSDTIIKETFKEEVTAWMMQLLLRKQIFRASHIITNIKLDPIEEFSRVFLNTFDDDLRDYLGDHLDNLEKLGTNHKETWNLLNTLKKNRLYLQNLKESLESLNIEILEKKSFDWKCEIGTNLFFKIYDPVLKTFITPKSAWSYLLEQNNTEFIKLWISLFYSKKIDLNFIHLDHQVFDLLTDIFSSLEITDELINLIGDFDCLEDSKNIILNEFSKFGVFCQEEKCNAIKILERLLVNGNILNLNKILSQSYSNISLFQFNEMLIDHCTSEDLYTVLNWCNIDVAQHEGVLQKYRSKQLNLLSYLNNCRNLSEKEDVSENISRVSLFLSDDLNSFLVSNPLILLALMLLSRGDIDLLELLKAQHSEIAFKDFIVHPQTVIESLNSLPFLKTVVNPPNFKSVAHQDLLNTHNFSFNFKLEGDTMPNFNSKCLVDKFGYKKTLNYTFYLKHGRPSFATKIFILNNRSKKSDYEEEVNKKMLKFVAKNFSNKDIMASCTAFLEMIGLNSKRMRVYIKAAEILHSSDDYNAKEIQNLLLNVRKDPESFLDALEKVSFKSCAALTDLDFLGTNLIEEIKKQELVVEFSKIHCLKLPQLFLQHCARNDLWLLFLLFVQVFNYPLPDVQKLLQNFPRAVLMEHLMHGVSQNIRVDDRRNLMMNDRDSRKYYLSRVGVFQNVDATSSSTYSSSFGSYGSTGSSTGSCDFSENENFDFVTDLLQILIKCHNCVDPPKALLHACHVYKNPLFAILSASYEPDSFITNWLIWLSISCGIETVGFNVDNVLINPEGVASCLVEILKLGYHKILHESFQIFLPDNPLIHFVDFLCECIRLNFDGENVIERLKLFEKERKQQGKCNVIVDGDYEMNFLINQYWLESTTIKLLAVTIQNNFSSRHDQLQFLKFLIDIKIENYFTTEFPNFQKLFDILSHLLENNCDIKLDLSVIFNKEIIKKEILNYVNEMLLERHYNCCYKIGDILNISTDFIAIKQCQDLFENRNEDNFWSCCDEILQLRNVGAHTAIEFFENCSTKVDDKNQLYQILKVACDWANRYDLSSIYDLEMKMWLAYIDIESLPDKFVDGNVQKMLYSEIKQKLQFFQHFSDHNLSEAQILNLNNTIESLLDDGNLWQASKISTIFKHQHKDLDMIILCCNLAEGLLKPDQLNVEQRLLLVKRGNFRNTSYRRHRPLLSSKGFSSVYSGNTTTLSMMDQDDVEIQDVLTVLDVLSNHIKCASQIFKNILITYRISANTDKTYEEVFNCKNSMDMIKEALNDNCINKLEVVNDFRLLFNWSEEETADFLCRELITSISDHINLNVEPVTIWNFSLDADFFVILQVLLENCSMLGLKLFSHVNDIHQAKINSKSDLNINNIRIMVELLIRSHDCFTSDCNMEGISRILRKCQVITELLHTVGGWKIIVRLLTGVARYTEMNYVFHILKENDQFEFLLCKGNRRDNHLKLALLKYIKKYCPENRELYRMVALHFTLFSEIAELWEEEAKSVIRNLIAISKLEMQNNGLNVEMEPFILFTNTDGTKLCLNRAMVNYTHATEYHLQGKKLTKAMNSARQAELLALQISLLKGLAPNGTAICIMRVNEAQISSLVCKELNFYQSLILVEAYNYKVDWSPVLFEQIVVHNQSSYLDNFLTSFTLTDTIVVDISKKFLNLKAISDTTIKNMKEIVNKCTGVCTKYRMASELGFYDLVEDLLAGSQLAYLKDTAFKTGFRN